MAAVMLLLSSDKTGWSFASVKLTAPLTVLTFAFARAVLMVTVPEASSRQKLGAFQVALTDSDVF
jgi:hypothetical protein